MKQPWDSEPPATNQRITMIRTTQILKEIEVMLMQAEMRVNLLNGDLDNPKDKSTVNKILAMQIEMEMIHHRTTMLENALLKKINTALRRVVEFLATEEEYDLKMELMKKEPTDH